MGNKAEQYNPTRVGSRTYLSTSLPFSILPLSRLADKRATKAAASTWGS